MAGTFPPAWNEVAIITIKPATGTAREFMAITETVDISEPDYPGESVMSLAGGRMWKQSGQEDGEVTLELYPIKVDDADNAGLAQQFSMAKGGTYDSAQPMITQTSYTAGVDRTREAFLVAIIWTDDTGVSDAITAPGTVNKVAKRFYAKNARFISHKSGFTDGQLKVTATFKFPAMNKAGTTRNFAWESQDGSGTTTQRLAAITYTTTHFD